MQVLKWALKPGYNEIAVPAGSTPLSVVAQRGVVVYVAVPDDVPEADKETLAFYCAQTGETFLNPGKFLGTVREPGAFVAHVFHVDSPLPGALTPQIAVVEEQDPATGAEA